MLAVPGSVSDQRPTGDTEVDVIESAASGEGGAAVVEEAEADEVVAGDEELCVRAVWRDADDAAAAVERGSDIDVAGVIERDALRASEAALIEDACVAVSSDGVDGLVGAGAGCGDKERAVVAKGEVVGGDGGLERGEDEDLAGIARAVGADFENRPGAVADERLPSRSNAMPVATPMPSAKVEMWSPSGEMR